MAIKKKHSGLGSDGFEPPFNAGDAQQDGAHHDRAHGTRNQDGEDDHHGHHDGHNGGDADCGGGDTAVPAVATEAADTLEGTDGADSIDGLGGDDIIFGNGGNDTLSGGTGADQIFAGAGDDMIFVAADDAVIDGGDGYDTVQLTGDAGFIDPYTVAAGWANIEEIIGTSQRDVINAAIPGVAQTGLAIDLGAGDDMAVATSGDDTFIASAGFDTFVGLEGTDTVVFAGDFADYYMERYGAVIGTADMRWGDGIVSDGSDMLDGIEVLQFADRTVLVADLFV